MFLLDWVLSPKVKVLLRALIARLVGFQPVGSWEVAQLKSRGYESENAIKSVLDGHQEFLSDLNTSEVVSTRFQQIATAFFFCVQELAISSDAPLRVLDVGGGSGDYYFLFRKFFPNLKLDWTVSETPALAAAMQSQYKSADGIKWLVYTDENATNYDLVLASSVL